VGRLAWLARGGLGTGGVHCLGKVEAVAQWDAPEFSSTCRDPVGDDGTTTSADEPMDFDGTAKDAVARLGPVLNIGESAPLSVVDLMRREGRVTPE